LKILSIAKKIYLIDFFRNLVFVEVHDRMRSRQSFRHFPPEAADLASRFWRSLVYVEDSRDDDLDLVKVGPDQSPNAEHAGLAGLDDLEKERRLCVALHNSLKYLR
jgi:hypothetical protein